MQFGRKNLLVAVLGVARLVLLELQPTISSLLLHLDWSTNNPMHCKVLGILVIVPIVGSKGMNLVAIIFNLVDLVKILNKDILILS